MKKLFPFIIALLFLFSCSNGLKSDGDIEVENGLGEKVNLRYHIITLENFNKQYSKEDFNYFIETALSKGKSICKNEATFNPLDFTIIVSNDTIISDLSFIAKNNYGVPDEMRIYLDFKGRDLIKVFPTME